ncbi:MAG: hypothetical protein MUF54_20150, partial [Polyangiaceae bacterium]|nr:hypothetical protein [Polyangiaceae bacterium]
LHGRRSHTELPDGRRASGAAGVPGEATGGARQPTCEEGQGDGGRMDGVGGVGAEYARTAL